MRIGLDFDNTLGDFLGLLMRVTQERTGFDLRAAWATGEDGEALAHAAIGRATLDALIAEIDVTDLSLELPPMPGAVEVTRRLAERHELFIVTARTDAESINVHRWLERQRIPIRGFIATARASKAPHAMEHGIAVHLDDKASVCEEFDEAHPTVPALLAHVTNTRATRAAHWRSVEDWLAFERLVQSLERER